MKLLLAIIGNNSKVIKDIKSSFLGWSKKVAVTQEIISPSFSNGFPSIAHRALGIVLLGVMNFIGCVNTWLPATPFARKWSLRGGSFHSIFFPRLSISTWKIMVELRKVFDAFFACNSQTTVRFNFRAEKKDQFMLLKEYKLSNSKFHQSLVQGDLPLSN